MATTAAAIIKYRDHLVCCTTHEAQDKLNCQPHAAEDDGRSVEISCGPSHFIRELPRDGRHKHDRCGETGKLPAPFERELMTIALLEHPNFSGHLKTVAGECDDTMPFPPGLGAGQQVETLPPRFYEIGRAPSLSANIALDRRRLEVAERSGEDLEEISGVER